MPVSEMTYRALAAEDFESGWELVCGQLRRKPGMTMEHNHVAWNLGFELQKHLPLDDFSVRVNQARLRTPSGDHYVPDVAVIPSSAMASRFGLTEVETYFEAVPLVVEIWSPSTGARDKNEKLAGYQSRGDAEIWLIDPIDRSATVYTREPAGDYVQRAVTRGSITPTALPRARVTLAAMFRGLP